ncbi:hypothetical protein [Spiroplasma endosymbiont of Colias croceus]|uniref:hypothetical protein n=1 Tax=Spiroplasma endosymbiont of Colias croceus TaxID=3066310 RepID=UPI0030D4BA7B
MFLILILEKESLTNNKYKTKIEKLNKKLQETLDDLKEISDFYAKSERDALDKRKIITNLANKITELETQLIENQQQAEIKNNNKKIIISKINLIIPGEICSLATDTKGNLYLGTRNSSWHGAIYKCLAGETNFKPILGIYGEIWTIAIDKNENVYIGTRESSFKGNVYKYQKNQNTFKKMDGINKSVSSLTFDNDDNIYAGVWTGSYQSPSNGEVYKCLAEETNFKPMSGIKGGVLSLFFNKNTNFLYVTTWNGDGKTKTNDGSLYKCLPPNNVFTLVQKNLPAIWHLKTKDSEPFIELEY